MYWLWNFSYFASLLLHVCHKVTNYKWVIIFDSLVIVHLLRKLCFWMLRCDISIMVLHILSNSVISISKDIGYKVLLSWTDQCRWELSVSCHISTQITKIMLWSRHLSSMQTKCRATTCSNGHCTCHFSPTWSKMCSWISMSAHCIVDGGGCLL